MEVVLNRALVFFIQTVFDFFVYVFILRLLFQVARCDYYNPVIQIIVKITDPVVKPLRRIIPSLGPIDTSTLLVAIVLSCFEKIIFVWLAGMPFNALGIVVWSFGTVLGAIINVYFFAIIIQALMSWFVTQPTPISNLLRTLNEPVLGRIRRALPGMSGLDISPLIALIGLQLINIVLIGPITHAGMKML